MKSLTIITVTHRSNEVLGGYISSFLRYNSHLQAEIDFVFIENSGEAIEKSVAPLQDAGFHVQYSEVSNHGFGSACNQGANLARGKILAFVNPDVTFLGPLGSLAKCIGTWGTIRQLDETGQCRSFDILPEFKTIFGELTKRHLKITNAFSRWQSRIFPVGAFFCVDRLTFEKLGGFNERFFLYYEEAELSRRLQREAGPPTFLPTHAILHHQFGSESDRTNTSAHEIDGLFTYAALTGFRFVIVQRILLLLLLVPVNRFAWDRLKQIFKKLRAQ
ncbi:glycosyltransferase family 2 protein [Sphingorhabdus sp.]|uniref:glycosyltransferase family 2 protein n=1 Tax=Sphingorhabdus sp. TaxID=1902408 RepID=UPI002FD9D520